MRFDQCNEGITSHLKYEAMKVNGTSRGISPREATRAELEGSEKWPGKEGQARSAEMKPLSRCAGRHEMWGWWNWSVRCIVASGD